MDASVISSEPVHGIEEHPDAVTVRFDRTGFGPTDRAKVTVSAPAPATLRRILPLLESLDIEALDEQTSSSQQTDGSPWHTYEFAVQAGRFARPAMLRGNAAAAVESAFSAMWHGLVDADDFNTLILAAELSWQQAAVLRALGRYLGQTRLPYGQHRIQQVLLDNPRAVRALVDLFEARFAAPGEAANGADRTARVAAARDRVTEFVQQATSLDADRVLRAYAGLINAIVRTNTYLDDALTEVRPWLSFKLRPNEIDELPDPRPEFEIFVYSPTVEGTHLRFGSISRGGVRWSDRLDDYRTEVLGLVKAQAVKNAVIVPAGAKGVFVPKPSPRQVHGRRRNSAAGDRAAGESGYRQFIGGLLDLTDNHLPDGTTEPPRSVVSYDEPDPYLVVAADKGTAQFSDIANEIALQRDFWLGDAFASGGAVGYDHKAMGITARGAWVSATQHLQRLGIDVASNDFTAIGIGDMSGDVFGNGMLLSKHLGLIAAFDHRHIFCDPTPNRAASYAERRRLFELGRSSWDDYNRELISLGGGVWPRTAKSVPVSSPLRDALGLPELTQTVTPDELIRAILCAPVDLLWNGGIGTYIKANDEQHLDVGDKFNDVVRVDASQVRARAIAEGGNLGISPAGRIEYARLGGLINSDAIDNAAGVDCSDHEVNIKIVLDGLAVGELPTAERIELLASMTEDVSTLVLANNVDHNRILSTARHDAPRVVSIHADMVADLEVRRGLHRHRENLPTAEEFAELSAAHSGLTSPQLATLLAHVKLDLKAALADDDILDDPHFLPALHAYFPTQMRERYAGRLDRHPLRREIISTVTINELVAIGGLTFAHRLSADTGATVSDVVRAYCIAADIFDIPWQITNIQATDLPVALINELTIEARRLLDRAARWLLLNRPQPLDPTREIARFRPSVVKLGRRVGAMLQGGEVRTVAAMIDRYTELGVPTDIARQVSESLYTFSLLDIIEAAQQDSGIDTAALAERYFMLSDRLGVDDLLVAVSSLARGDRWQAQARSALREDLYRSLKALTLDVATAARAQIPGTPLMDIQRWEGSNTSRIQRSRRALIDIHNQAPHNLATLSVATTHIRRMICTR